MNDFQVSPELVGIYLEDARAHLDALDACLLALEREGLVADHVTGVLGPLHTLKGNSGMMGFVAVKDYVHRLEDVFARIQDGSVALEGGLFDRLFAGASSLRDAVEQACRQGAEVRDLGKEKSLLDALLAAADAAPAAPMALAPLPRVAAAPPPPASLAPAAEPAGAAEIEERADAAARYVGARSNMVRVDFGQLDHLLNLVGELVIYRNKLHEVGHRLSDSLGGKSDAGRELLEAVQQVAGVSAQLQETVMDIRMLPIRHVFERFPRLVRDLAKGQGKDIELILEGEGTRVDKAIIDEIGEPLVHMIRNAVDHGIEPPAVRQAAGKTPTATILLSAAQESNHVVLTIMDDGGGIDPVRVRQKAIERGLLRGDEPIGEREALQLIFTPGFSTRDAVSELSGRGVGLDVVLKSIERLNGLVDVESVPGVGTKFVIQLPLTLAIISALLVEASGRTYAIPLGAVVESLKFDRHEVHRIGGRETLRIRERVVPLLRLTRLFDLPEGERTARHEYAVVLGRGDKRVGLVVDRLRGQQEVVIKALDAAVTTQAFGIAGATIMGDGRVVLIVDVAALFEGRRHTAAVREVLAEA
ncbi:MAG: chemotaxis protein CheA [Vicinamibacteria bacterium]|jgi:two-component system chemotaxis sensor kinase CheA|nr:chemotaxis protein CheA [Vicinamibacteria bacterium]